MRAITEAVDDTVHGTRTETVCDRLEASPQRLGDAFEFVKDRGILVGAGGLWLHPRRFEEGCARFLAALADAHRMDPASGAVPPRKIAERAELGWTPKAAARIARELVEAGRLKGDESGVRLPDFRPQVGAKSEATIARLAGILDEAGFRPPVGAALAAAANLPTQALAENLRLGEFLDRLVPMESGIWTTPAIVDRAHRELLRAADGGRITIGGARTALDASRRYAHAFLVRLAEEGRARPGDGEWLVLPSSA